MALEKLADRITQDTCSVLLLFAFTLIRILVLRSNAKTAHSILPSELFSVLCLVFTTFCVVAQVAVSEVDNRIRFGLTDPAAIAAHEYEPLTLQVGQYFESILLSGEIC